MGGYFVTATGTDVGKTYVTAGIVAAVRRTGRDARAVKPVMSGYGEAGAGASDAGVLLRAMGAAPTPEAVAAIAPWRFAAPLSPDMAAAREGRALALAELVAFSRSAAAEPDLLLCEGAGGVLVPLTDSETTLDWMVALGWPVVLVAGSYLGTISHTLTAARCLAAAGLGIAALAISESAVSPVPPGETAAAIARFCAAPAWVLPRGDAAAFVGLAAALV